MRQQHLVIVKCADDTVGTIGVFDLDTFIKAGNNEFVAVEDARGNQTEYRKGELTFIRCEAV